MSGHAQKFWGNFPKIVVVKFEKKNRLVRKTPKLAKSVTISYIHLFLVVDNPKKLVPFLTVYFLKNPFNFFCVNDLPKFLLLLFITVF
jgi:hypothetical protein